MSHEFEVKPGRISCPVCFIDFVINERDECKLVDMENFEKEFGVNFFSNINRD